MASKRLRTYQLSLLGRDTEELYVRDAKPTIAEVTSVTRSDTAVQALAENPNRMGAIFYNDTSATCAIKFGSNVSASDLTRKLAAGATWELPQPVYTGLITVGWAASGSDKLFVTELSESETL